MIFKKSYFFSVFQLMLELLLSSGVTGIEPLDNFVAFVGYAFPVSFRDFLLHFSVLDGILHVEAVRLEVVFRYDPLLLRLVLRVVSFRFVHHSFYVLFSEPSLVVGYRYLVLLVRRLLHGGHVQDTIRVDVEGHLKSKRIKEG